MPRTDSTASAIPCRAPPGGWALALGAAAVLALGGMLGGCLDDAAGESYKFDNPLDTTPEGGGDDDESGQLSIAFVNSDIDVLVLANGSLIDENLGGWTLEDVNETETFLLPDFELSAGAIVRVHTNDTSGTDDGDDIYASGGNTVNWIPADDGIVLRDDLGDFQDECDNGDSCWP